MIAVPEPAGPPSQSRPPPVPAMIAGPGPAGPPSPPYPAGLEISYSSELNRWLPLVKWLLVIPHLFVLFFVGIGAFFRRRVFVLRRALHEALAPRRVRLPGGDV